MSSGRRHAHDDGPPSASFDVVDSGGGALGSAVVAAKLHPVEGERVRRRRKERAAVAARARQRRDAGGAAQVVRGGAHAASATASSQQRALGHRKGDGGTVG